MNELIKWAPIVAIALSAISGAITWLIGRTLVSKDQFQDFIEGVTKDRQALEKRVLHLEEGAQTTPGWGALRDLGDRVHTLDGGVRALGEKVEGLRNTMSAEIGGMREQLTGTRELLGVLNEHLLKGERG